MTPCPDLSPLSTPTGLFIIDGKSTLRQLIVNDLPVGRSVDEVLRLVQAYQFTDEHGEGESPQAALLLATTANYRAV